MSARLEAQVPRWGIAVAPTNSYWTGPYQEGGDWSFSSGLWAEARTRTRAAIRAELAAGSFIADLGTLGFLSDGTSLWVNNLQLGALARVYSAPPAVTLQRFLDIGIAVWRRTSCDVDTAGGSGFFGGHTESCSEWARGGDGEPLLKPRAGGLVLLAGAGLRRSRLGAAVRYAHLPQPVVETRLGSLHVRQLVLSVEWAFGR